MQLLSEEPILLSCYFASNNLYKSILSLHYKLPSSLVSCHHCLVAGNCELVILKGLVTKRCYCT